MVGSSGILMLAGIYIEMMGDFTRADPVIYAPALLIALLFWPDWRHQSLAKPRSH